MKQTLFMPQDSLNNLDVHRELPKDVTDIQCGPGAARRVRKALVCMVGRTSESNTAAQRTRLKPPRASVLALTRRRQTATTALGGRWRVPGKTPGGGFSGSFRPPEARGVRCRAHRQQSGGRRRGAGADPDTKTNGNNLDVWRALAASVPDSSLLGSLLQLCLPLGFGLQVPALPFLEATLLVLCLRLRRKEEGKAVVSARAGGKHASPHENVREMLPSVKHTT